MFHIVTDGAVDMPADWAEKYNIHVLPLRIRFGEKTYTQGEDLSSEGFYQLVKENRVIPKTSLPSPLQVVEFYRKFARKGDQLLSIHISSKLSGTYSTCAMAAKELEDELEVVAFDSGAGSAAMGVMCREARLWERAGMSLQEITSRLERMRQRVSVIFTVDNLEFARLSGRIGSLQSVLASVLNIKPIIILRDGLLNASEKIRTRQKALDHILVRVRDGVGNRKVIFAVVHAADLETAKSLMERAKKMFNISETLITDLSIPVAANLGPGTIGVVAIPVED